MCWLGVQPIEVHTPNYIVIALVVGFMLYGPMNFGQDLGWLVRRLVDRVKAGKARP